MGVLATRKRRIEFDWSGRKFVKEVEDVAFDEGDRVLVVRPVLCIESCRAECSEEDEDFDECVAECIDLYCSSPDEEVGEEEEYIPKDEFLRSAVERGWRFVE